jgi:hypothetical protein
MGPPMQECLIHATFDGWNIDVDAGTSTDAPISVLTTVGRRFHPTRLHANGTVVVITVGSQ